MRYWLDCEFIDDGHTIDLVSIGIVAEDGRELYLQSTEFDINKASQWVRENVIMHLDICPHITQPAGPLYSLGTLYGAQAQHKNGQCLFTDETKGMIEGYTDCPWRTREQIKCEVLMFLDAERYGYPELIGWCCAYDFVVLCQLFGTMMDVPRFVPHYMHDLQQVLDERGIADDEVPQSEGQAHNALIDARQMKSIWKMLY